MKAITQPSMIKYPTLWSSNVTTGDILINRQGYAVPIGETEWAELRSPMTAATAVMFGMQVSKRTASAIDAAWEKNKEANDYYSRKFTKEFLGIAMTSAKHGQDVFVDTPERLTT